MLLTSRNAPFPSTHPAWPGLAVGPTRCGTCVLCGRYLCTATLSLRSSTVSRVLLLASALCSRRSETSTGLKHRITIVQRFGNILFSVVGRGGVVLCNFTMMYVFVMCIPPHHCFRCVVCWMKPRTIIIHILIHVKYPDSNAMMRKIGST
jgi:hypothetical protein